MNLSTFLSMFPYRATELSRTYRKKKIIKIMILESKMGIVVRSDTAEYISIPSWFQFSLARIMIFIIVFYVLKKFCCKYMITYLEKSVDF